MKKLLSITKKFLPLLIIFGISLLSTQIVSAQEEAPEIDVLDAIDTITNWLFTILLLVAVIMFIIAGFQFVTAGGDPDTIKQARDKLMYGVIGIITAFLAKGIVAFIENIFI